MRACALSKAAQASLTTARHAVLALSDAVERVVAHLSGQP